MKKHVTFCDPVVSIWKFITASVFTVVIMKQERKMCHVIREAESFIYSRWTNTDFIFFSTNQTLAPTQLPTGLELKMDQLIPQLPTNWITQQITLLIYILLIILLTNLIIKCVIKISSVTPSLSQLISPSKCSSLISSWQLISKQIVNFITWHPVWNVHTFWKRLTLQLKVFA